MDVSDGEADGFQLLKTVCKLVVVPVIAISLNGKSGHIIKILNIADDYLQKPIDAGICAAKIQALLRRSGKQETALCAPPIMMADSPLFIDPARRKVVYMKTEIHMPRIAFDLLYMLASNPGQVFTHEQLYNRIWGSDFDGNDVPLQSQISHLRHSLKAIPDSAVSIKCLRGVGYSLDIKKGNRG